MNESHYVFFANEPKIPSGEPHTSHFKRSDEILIAMKGVFLAGILSFCMIWKVRYKNLKNNDSKMSRMEFVKCIECARNCK